jgi:hypothetical protein
MKVSTILVSTFLTWSAYDSNLFRRRRDSFTSNQTSISLTAEDEELREAKAVQRHRLDVIPARYRRVRTPVRLKCNYFSTKSRDVRDSDQKKIRRRFNNL